jgi:hypothetical protein
MNPEMKIIREVSIQAEDFYDDAVKLGDHAARAFQSLSASKKNSHRSQMTSLENIAESTLKISDVFDYIKKQTARHDYWRKPVQGQKDSKQGFGERLINYLENDLLNNVKAICNNLKIVDTTDEHKQQSRYIYLQLIRQFIRKMVVEYEYQVSLGNKKKEP